jgi:hypothetical protein
MSESSINGGGHGGGEINGYDGPGGYTTETYTPPRRPAHDDAPF